MPTHRSVAVWLESQYAMVVPETLSASSRKLLPIGSRTITANIPTLSSSQFWICYRCPLPPPPKPEGDETRFYYFKLYISGRNILSWGIGEQEQWSGKTMFGLYDAGSDFEGRKLVEKRGFFFPEEGKLQACEEFEIRVFRAKARKREECNYESFSDLALGKDGLQVTTIGRKKKGERQRKYTYALIDPKDSPYVAFKYMLRTTESIRQLESNDFAREDGRGTSTSPISEPVDCVDEHDTHFSSPPRFTRIVTSPLAGESEMEARMRRLSMPPRKSLRSSTSQAEPSSPVKKEISRESDGKVAIIEKSQSASVISGRAMSELWDRNVKTPSPTYADRGCFLTPGTPPSKRKKATSGLLRNVVASALKRKERIVQ